MKALSSKQELNLLHRITDIISSTINLTELLRKISRMVLDFTKSDSCLIYLYEKKENSLVLLGAHNPHPGAVGKVKLKLGEGLTGWVAQHKKPLAISKKSFEDHRFKYFSNLPEDKFESFLSVPILSGPQLIGVMNLHRKKAYTYRPSEITLLTTISKQVSGSIQNARLFEEVNQKNKHIETLAQVSRSISGESYLEEILRFIVSITAESVGFKICSLMLLDDKNQELSIVATQSLSENYKEKPPFKVEKSLSGKAIIQKKPIAIYDVREEPGYQYPEMAKQEGMASLLSVPMLVRQKCIGVLNCYTHEPHHFTDTEIKMLASVAHQAAIAIENTRLTESAHTSKKELEDRKLIERAKGILMNEKNVSEDHAFKEMRKVAMDRRKSMREIAEAIILSRELQQPTV